MKEIAFSQLANFQPKQQLAFETLFTPQCKYLLYGGAGSGGKSYWLRWTMLALVLYYTQKYNLRGVEVGLFSEDYPTLRDRQIGKIKREFPLWLGELRNSQDTGYAFHIRDEYGGGLIKLRNLDDPSKYASAEFAAIGVEEITKNKEETFDDLRFRMRWAGVEDVKFAAATNPGQIGHVWVRRKWVKPDVNKPDKEQERFFYIPATVYDNKYVPQDYINQLEALPEKKRKMLLLGSWDVPEGQVFEEWNDDIHTIQPFIPDSNATHVLWMDWGFSEQSAAAIYLSAIVEQKTKEGDTFNRVITYKEWYGNSITPKDWARKVFSYCREHNIKPHRGYADSNMFAPRDGSRSLATMMTDEWKDLAGKPWLRLEPGSKSGRNSRINRTGMIHEWLSIAGDGLPYWMVTRNCVNLIRTLPDLVYDEAVVDAYDTDQEDHAVDASAYGLEKVKFTAVKPGSYSAKASEKKKYLPLDTEGYPAIDPKAFFGSLS